MYYLSYKKLFLTFSFFNVYINDVKLTTTELDQFIKTKKNRYNHYKGNNHPFSEDSSDCVKQCYIGLRSRLLNFCAPIGSE